MSTSELAEQILQLRSQGKTYTEIAAELGCSKGTISYHCGAGQKVKTRSRNAKNQEKDGPVVHSLRKRISFFRNETPRPPRSSSYDLGLDKYLYGICRHFQDRTIKGPNTGKISMTSDDTFTVDEMIASFGDEPSCYLTGDKIDLNDLGSYELDHKQPVARGGTNDLSNLGLTSYWANRSKDAMTVEEYVELCVKVARHFGYTITKDEPSVEGE